MSKQRLSKLQKWILTKCFESQSSLDRGEIYQEYFGLSHKDRSYPCHKKDENGCPLIYRRDAAYVSVSRSLKNLKEKGLIIDNFQFCADLTDKGKEKALILIPMELNNKRLE